VEVLRRQKELVAAIHGHAKWDRFRQFRNQKLFAEVKEVVWNLIPDDLDLEVRGQANFDLFAVMEAAASLAGETMLSEHEITFGWHRAGEVFAAAAHKAVDPPAGFEERGSADWRLRLGITPTVTARALEGRNIAPRLALRAQVLVAN
jgi:hypothetical protein